MKDWMNLFILLNVMLVIYYFWFGNVCLEEVKRNKNVLKKDF